MKLSIICALLLAASVAGTADDAKLPHRYQVSNIPEQSTERGWWVVNEEPKAYLRSDGENGAITTVDISAAITDKDLLVTTFTRTLQPTHDEKLDHERHFEEVKSEACIDTRLMSIAELEASKEKFEHEALIILKDDKFHMAKDKMTEFVENIKGKKVILGFQKKKHVLEEVMREQLQHDMIPFIEYLDISSKLNDAMSSTSSTKKRFYAFKHTFVMFKNGTSFPPNATDEEHKADERDVLRNLVDVVVFEADQTMIDVCSKVKDAKINQLSYDLVEGAYPPLASGLHTPSFVPHKTKPGLWLRFSTEIGTHVVPPRKFASNGQKLEELDEESFFGPCFRFRATPDDAVTKTITAKKLKEIADSIKEFPQQAIVLIDSGFGKTSWSTPDYHNDHPALELAAAQYLIETLKVAAIGIDAPLLDLATSKDTPDDKRKYPVHDYLAEKSKLAILNVKINNTLFPEEISTARCVVSYLRGTGIGAAPAGIFALLDYGIVVGDTSGPTTTTAATTMTTTLESSPATKSEQSTTTVSSSAISVSATPESTLASGSSTTTSASTISPIKDNEKAVVTSTTTVATSSSMTDSSTSSGSTSISTSTTADDNKSSSPSEPASSSSTTTVASVDSVEPIAPVKEATKTKTSNANTLIPSSAFLAVLIAVALLA